MSSCERQGSLFRKLLRSKFFSSFSDFILEFATFNQVNKIKTNHFLSRRDSKIRSESTNQIVFFQLSGWKNAMFSAYIKVEKIGLHVVKIIEHNLIHNHAPEDSNEIHDTSSPNSCSDLTEMFLTCFPRLEFATYLELKKSLSEFEAAINDYFILNILVENG